MRQLFQNFTRSTRGLRRTLTVGAVLATVGVAGIATAQRTPTRQFTEEDVSQILRELRGVDPDTYYIRLPVFRLGRIVDTATYGTLPITEVRRVATVLNPIEALELILETKPDLVITAQVLPRMSGVDLACALAAMPATKGIPVALLTSLDPDHPDLRALPMNVGLIRRGKQFGDDLADVLQRFHIT